MAFSSDQPEPNDVLMGCIPTQITTEMNNELELEVSDEEIQVAVFEIGGQEHRVRMIFRVCSSKRTGTWWAQTSSPRLSAIPPTLNYTDISPIPKVPRPSSASDCRPISLCNFIYKILSKVLVNRLEVYLPNLISPFQSVFIAGQMIQDNVLVVYEVFHYLQHRTRGGRIDVH